MIWAKVETKWKVILYLGTYPHLQSDLIFRNRGSITFYKSHGQSLKQVDPFLLKSVFNHEQLYVVLSRVKSAYELKIYLPNDAHAKSTTTLNIVYKEVFTNISA